LIFIYKYVIMLITILFWKGNNFLDISNIYRLILHFNVSENNVQAFLEGIDIIPPNTVGMHVTIGKSRKTKVLNLFLPNAKSKKLRLTEENEETYLQKFCSFFNFAAASNSCVFVFKSQGDNLEIAIVCFDTDTHLCLDKLFPNPLTTA